MNADFPRIITLLRKERNISQKQAAADLGVSQALLSHYEKGIRECGLDFLVKTADYYNVSCDYLLGRCAEPGGKAETAAPVVQGNNNENDADLTGLHNSQRLIFSLLRRCGDKELEGNVRSYLSLAVYRIFRLIYSANPKNDYRFFTVNSPAADGFVLSAMEIKRSRAENRAKQGVMQNASITTNSISEDFPECASAFLNGIKQCEETVSEVMGVFEDETRDKE
ncbi:MAG: helix-turn-helix transcriptional regulator [Oscillospiraceae bacterium]|nr:helix-turn-helix transcriptional regulator [Oscillospiraceae bacterium]